jgi:hypothetical protein
MVHSRVVSEVNKPKVTMFFDPPVPQSAMVHCYLRGPRDVLEECHAAVRKKTGVGVLLSS